MAFTAAESKGSRIVTNERYALTWIAGLRAKVTGFDSIDELAKVEIAIDGFIVKKIASAIGISKLQELRKETGCKDGRECFLPHVGGISF